MHNEWEINQHVNINQTTLRQLLQTEWLIPRRIVHYLRIRQDVLVNDHYQPMNTEVNLGDEIKLHFVSSDFRTAVSNYVTDASVVPEVLFENDNLLVVNKPSGIKSHPNWAAEKGTLMNFAATYLKESGTQPYMVHRIDQQTSGAVVIAKNPVVVPILDRLIAQKSIQRIYLAIVNGVLPKQQGQIDLPIGQDPDDQRKRKINGLNAQKALTYYEVLASNDDYSLVQLTLETGRTHQIRLHLQSLDCPIVNDPLYGNDTGAAPMLLHGRYLKLILPFEMSHLTITAPVPNYFQTALDQLLSPSSSH